MDGVLLLLGDERDGRHRRPRRGHGQAPGERDTHNHQQPAAQRERASEPADCCCCCRAAWQDVSNGKIYYGRSANTDIVVAATQAYLSAINTVVDKRHGLLPMHPQFGKV